MANGPISDQDVASFRSAGFSGAELMWYADPRIVPRLGSPPENIVVRLPDSVQNGRILGRDEYIQDCLSVIRNFYPMGVRNFQLDNEPNWSWGQDKRYEWHYFTREVVNGVPGHQGLREALDSFPGVRLGFTPFSWPNQQEWLAVNADLVPQFDWIAVHAYWQPARDMLNPYFGAQVVPIHRMFPGKPLLVTERANSSQEEQNPPSPAVMDRLRAAQYPQYVRWLRTLGYVQGVYFYILGGTQDWSGFRLTEPVLQAVATEQDLDISVCFGNTCRY